MRISRTTLNDYIKYRPTFGKLWELGEALDGQAEQAGKTDQSRSDLDLDDEEMR